MDGQSTTLTGKQVRAIRNKMGLSQGVFATLLGYKRLQTISEIEHDKKTLSRAALIILLYHIEIQKLIEIAKFRNAK